MTDAASDAGIERSIAELLGRRRPGGTICPSEVARDVASDDEAAWRPLMPHVRRVASRLAAAGMLRVTRGGVEVDAEAPGGPIRLGRPNPA